MFLHRSIVSCTVLTSAFLLQAAPAPAQAATASGTIAVSATVLSFCTITTTPLVFGNYSSVALAATTTVGVACTLGTSYNLGLDVGVGAGATVAARQMTFGVNTLAYGLFRDSSRTLVWGPTIGTNTQAATGTGLVQTYTVYGQIPAGQLAAPGLYADTVTATVTY